MLTKKTALLGLSLYQFKQAPPLPFARCRAIKLSFKGSVFRGSIAFVGNAPQRIHTFGWISPLASFCDTNTLFAISFVNGVEQGVQLVFTFLILPQLPCTSQHDVQRLFKFVKYILAYPCCRCDRAGDVLYNRGTW